MCMYCGNELTKRTDQTTINSSNNLQGNKAQPSNPFLNIDGKTKKIIGISLCVIISAVVCIVPLAKIVSMPSSYDNTYDEEYDENAYSEVYEETVDESETQAIENSTEEVQNSDLAMGCERIVCTAKDKNGTLYEIVAQVEESYNGSQLQIGVIKNGSWLIEWTTDCPFIDDNLDWEWHSSGTNIDYISCTYLSNGTFNNSSQVFWNVETRKAIFDNKDYDFIASYNDVYYDPRYEEPKDGDHEFTDADKQVLIIAKDDPNDFAGKIYVLCFLDTKTLSIKETDTVFRSEPLSYSQIHEGLFAIKCVETHDGFYNYYAFYNEQGQKVFDLKDLCTKSSSVVNVGKFKSGKCYV